jgi:hypothetical protein
VSQGRINAHLGREIGDPRTSAVLRKLEEAGYVSGTGKFATHEADGPLVCEPTTKTFERLEGWPASSGDVALARFVGAIEARIAETDDQEEQTKLRRVLSSVQDVGESVMAQVLSRLITGGMG